MSLPIRYVLNLRTGTAHDRRHLDERCNTDQIERRFKFTTDTKDEVGQHSGFRRWCRYCRPVIHANPDTEVQHAGSAQ